MFLNRLGIHSKEEIPKTIELKNVSLDFAFEFKYLNNIQFANPASSFISFSKQQ